MTPNSLLHYAEKRLEQIKQSIAFNTINGASPERIQELQMKRRTYQLIIAQQEKEN